MKIIKIIDTREKDSSGVSIKKTGQIRTCDICGSLHEIHVTVLNNGIEQIIGLSCAKKNKITEKQITKFKKGKIQSVDEIFTVIYGSYSKNGRIIEYVRTEKEKIKIGLFIKMPEYFQQKEIKQLIFDKNLI